MSKVSKPELEVYNFLSKYFKVLYEQPIYVTDLEERPRVWSPDFYLPELGIYIEVCGAERYKDYVYRKKVYSKNLIPVIFVETYKYHPNQWKKYIFIGIMDKHKERDMLLQEFIR